MESHNGLPMVRKYVQKLIFNVTLKFAAMVKEGELYHGKIEEVEQTMIFMPRELMRLVI